MRFATRPPRARLIAVMSSHWIGVHAQRRTPRDAVLVERREHREVEQRHDQQTYAEDEHHNRHDTDTTADQRERADADQHER